jgi:hypothetical protein
MPWVSAQTQSSRASLYIQSVNKHMLRACMVEAMLGMCVKINIDPVCVERIKQLKFISTSDKCY